MIMRLSVSPTKSGIDESVRNRIAGILLALLFCFSIAEKADAVVFDTTTGNITTAPSMFDDVFSNNSVQSCTACHSSSQVDVLAGDGVTVLVNNRHGAPVGSDYDNDAAGYASAASRANDGTLDSYIVSNDLMPNDPNDVDFTFAGALSATEKSIADKWIQEGAPFAAASVNTGGATSISKTSATLRASVNPNLDSTTPLAKQGTAYFEYGTSTAYGSTTAAITGLTGTTNSPQSASITGLNCGTTYQYRGVATNLAGTLDGGTGIVNGSNQSFTTSACDDPVIAFTAGAPAAFDEHTDQTFQLSVTSDATLADASFTWSISSQGAKGSASFDTSATASPVTVRYTPTPHANGADSVTVRVTNTATGQFDDFVVSLAITAVADAPEITQGASVTVTMDEDASPTAFSLTLNATDPDGTTTFDWDIFTQGAGVASVGTGTGASQSISYTPVADANGINADSFVVAVWDGGAVGAGNSAMITVQVDITAQPDAPTAVDDVGVVILEGAVDTLITVITNDTDPDAGEAATLVPVNVQVVSGDITSTTVVGSRIQVTHGGAEELTASLSYQVQDVTGRTSANTATVSISITATDDPPISAAINAGNVNEGTSINIDALAVSVDPEGATMAICDTLTAPVSGNATVSLVGGQIQYSHDGTDVALAGESDSFTYQVNDANDASCSSGNNSTFSTVTISLVAVNDLPVAVADSITVAEGGTVTLLDSGNSSVLANDTDEENGTGIGLTVSATDTQPASSTAFSLNADGSFSYQHDGSEPVNTSFSYTVNDGSADSSVPGIVSITVTPVNDAPVITSTAPTTALVFTEEIAADIYQLTQSDEDDNTFTYSLGGTGLAGDTPAGDMAISATGLITWTPPRVGVVQASAQVTVTVTDVASTGGVPASVTQSFSITTQPVDSDADGIADYADNCPTVANADQADLDNDTAHLAVDASGIPADGDVDASATDAPNLLGESYLRGGDACDEDIDGDGLSNAFEERFAFLDPFDANDALADQDGDGLSNIDEFLAGTAIDADNAGPVVTPPANITLSATGYLTQVDIGEASAVDDVEGRITAVYAALNKSGGSSLDACSDLSALAAKPDALRPGRHTITWAACDSLGNLGLATQIVRVHPIVSISRGSVSGEGRAVSIPVMLNGDAASYPVTVNYRISGTASGADHTAASGSLTFAAAGETASIDFDVVADTLTENDETLIFTLSEPSNAVLGNSSKHILTITDTNVPPQVSWQVTQAGQPRGSSVYQTDGIVSVIANAVDVNGDALRYDWSTSDNAILAIATIDADNITFDPTLLSGSSLYRLQVRVSDGSARTTVNRLVSVKTGAEVTLSAGQDTDGDGTDDDVEGLNDSDGDGIPDYLDSSATPAYVIETQTGNLAGAQVMETEPGLAISLGATAIAADVSGVLVSPDDVAAHGGARGGSVANAATNYTFISGLFSFDIAGLTPSMQSVDVVLPLPSAIQSGAVYRKFIAATGWADFVEDDLNRISSARGENGSCPEPGSNDFKPGLNVLDNCIQLTIQDGGANDADGLRNYIIRDPGGLAIEPVAAGAGTPGEPTAAESGANGRLGAMNLLVLVSVFLLVAGLRIARAGRRC